MDYTQVDKDLYDRKYFTGIDFDLSGSFDMPHKYIEIASKVAVNSGSKIVDYGCGTGNLSFYLNEKYKVPVVGIDYAPDAIEICIERMATFRKNRGNSDIKFICANNHELPNLTKIDVVFFSDVVEHMYDHEIKIALDKVRTWNNKVKIVIRTDNLNYLRYVNSFVEVFLLVFFPKDNKERLLESHEHTKALHINLKTPKKHIQDIERLGWRLVELSYPEVTEDKVMDQLGALSKLPFITKITQVALSRLPFLSPSFYAVFESC